MSHESPDLYDRGRHDEGVRRHMGVMQRVTGYAPPTCPWRVMYSPLVREVIAALEFEEHGNLAVGVGVDPPGLLVDAIGGYKQALQAVRDEDAKIAAENAKRNREARR